MSQRDDGAHEAILRQAKQRPHPRQCGRLDPCDGGAQAQHVRGDEHPLGGAALVIGVLDQSIGIGGQNDRDACDGGLQ